MPRIVRTVVVITLLLGIARGASAQRPVLASSDAPPAEIGLYGGLWNLEPSGQVGLGGRVAINRSEWLGTEISLEAKRGESNSTTQRALIANACAKAAESYHTSRQAAVGPTAQPARDSGQAREARL